MTGSGHGTELRRLRLSAGLSQTELARRLKVPASVLSAYENGKREPKVDIFFHAVEAAGFRIEYVPAERRSKLELVVPDAKEKAAILLQVCGLAMALPRRDRGELTFPPFRTLRQEVAR